MKEHDVVRTLNDIRTEDNTIPKGTLGTIVHVYPSVLPSFPGTVFEVEFPNHKEVVTLMDDAIRRYPMLLKHGDILNNGARVVVAEPIEDGFYVLAIKGNEYVTWFVDSNGDATSGHYHAGLGLASLSVAVKDLEERVSGLVIPC